MTKTFTYGLVPRDEIMARSGLSFLTDMAAGKLPQPPMCETLGFYLAEVKEGYACFEGLPEKRHYNPIGTVHGGLAATLLDSALGCAIFSTLAAGEAWTTLELKLNLVRPITEDTGLIRCEGRLIHRGRTVATSDGTVKDRAGKLYAHATTTCMIFPANAGQRISLDVMAGHSRSKNGVASLAYVPAIHAFLGGQGVDAWHKAGHDVVT